MSSRNVRGGRCVVVAVAQETAAAERTVALGVGFNLVGWTGAEPIAAADAAAASSWGWGGGFVVPVGEGFEAGEALLQG